LLWVVGSYAQRAPTCGDLDLLLDLEVIEESMLPIQKLLRQAVGVFPDVRYNHGKREENGSRIARRRGSAIQRHHARGALVAPAASDGSIVGEVHI
jgi:hypothetical protein